MIRTPFPLAATLALGLAACQQGGATAQDPDKTEAPEIAATPAAFTPWLRIYLADHAGQILGAA